MQRRPLLTLAAALAATPLAARAAKTHTLTHNAPDFAGLERRAHGQLGFFALDTGSGRTLSNRADQRFATASAFKILLAARVAHGVDHGRWTWEDTVELNERDRVPHSPTFDRLLPRGRATLAELVRGVLVESDNPSANLLLRRCCDTPAGLTAWLREQGDTVTRLDRWETELNENAPGDPRDTTTPRAFAATLQHLLLGPVLSRASQARLYADMQATQIGAARLKAGAPAGWRVLDRTGSGNRGSINDVALVFPPGDRAPWVVVAMQSGSDGSIDDLAAVLASAMKQLVQAWG